MCRVAMLALCAAMIPGCVSVNGGGRPMGSIVGQTETPEPGQWCIIRLTDEQLGPSSKRMTYLWGRVDSVDEAGVQLVDVIEEERILSGPNSLRDALRFRQLPAFDSEFFLKESRHIARGEILSYQKSAELEVVAKRNSLIEIDGKLVQEPRGLDFDFDVPVVAQREDQ